MQQSVWNVCAKFKVYPLSCFHTGARQVFTTYKFFPSKIPLTMKTATSTPFKHIFWSSYHLSNFFWNIWQKANWCSSKKVNIWTPSGYFLFFISYFHWNAINKNFSRVDTRKIRSSRLSLQAATLLKNRLCHRCFPVNFAKFLGTPFLTTPPVAASYRWKIVKPITLQRNFLTLKWSLCKKHLYKALSINSCSMDVRAIKNTSSKS